MKYLVISRTEDEPHAELISKTALENELNEEWKENYTFINELPLNMEEFPSWSIFIMKGDIIIPKAVKVVKQLKID